MQTVVGVQAVTTGYGELLDSEAQLVGYLREPEGVQMDWDASIRLQCAERY